MFFFKITRTPPKRISKLYMPLLLLLISKTQVLETNAHAMRSRVKYGKVQKNPTILAIIDYFLKYLSIVVFDYFAIGIDHPYENQLILIISYLLCLVSSFSAHFFLLSVQQSVVIDAIVSLKDLSVWKSHLNCQRNSQKYIEPSFFLAVSCYTRFKNNSNNCKIQLIFTSPVLKLLTLLFATVYRTYVRRTCMYVRCMLYMGLNLFFCSFTYSTVRQN